MLFLRTSAANPDNGVDNPLTRKGAAAKKPIFKKGKEIFHQLLLFLCLTHRTSKALPAQQAFPWGLGAKKDRGTGFWMFARPSVFLCFQMKYEKLAVVAHVLQNVQNLMISLCFCFFFVFFFFAVNVTRSTKIYNARALLFFCILNLLLTISFPLPLAFALSSVQAANFTKQILTVLNDLTLVMVVFMTSSRKIGIDISKI